MNSFFFLKNNEPRPSPMRKEFLRKLLHAIALFSFIFSTSTVANSLLSYRFNHLTTDQGLPSNGVTALYQDPKGLIWIGTVNGLALYDGKKNQSIYQS
jgi:ligand-binding sensor domain-containing protein